MRAFWRRTPTIDMVHYDHTGWELTEQHPDGPQWATPTGAAVRLMWTPGDPATRYPFRFDDLPTIRAFYTEQAQANGGAMIEVEPAQLADCLAFRGTFKYRFGPSLGFYYVGILVTAFRDVTIKFNTEAMERGTTGMREAMVAAIAPWNPPADQEPIPVSSMEEFFNHIRAAPVRTIPSDDPQYDSMIPTHPLSLVRELQRHLMATTRFDPALRTRPPYVYQPRQGTP